MSRPSTQQASFLAALHAGRFRWDLLNPFPMQEAADRAAGDDAIAELTALLSARVDSDELDASRQLPPDIVTSLADAGYLGMTVPAHHGGRGFSPFNTFRLLEAAARSSGAIGLLLAVHNGLSVAAYLAALPPGRVRDFVVTQLAEGKVCGVADTEPGGAANSIRRTVAVPVEDGTAYLLSGEKCFIGNARIAGLLAVSATVCEGGHERVDLFLVDTASPGFEVVAGHDFLGLCGAPSAALRLDRVHVPADRVLVASDGGWRSSPLVNAINALARMYITVAPALGLARLCLAWARDFLARRTVDGRPLADYDAVQRLVATSAAEVFAVDGVVEWCLLGDQAALRLPERIAAKNIGTLTGWRVVDRTMSLFGAEGLETARSKARRGIPPAPLERAFRDVRAMRIAGGVDFHIDFRAAWSSIIPAYRAGRVDAQRLAEEANQAPGPAAASLTAANRANLAFARQQTVELAARCLALVRAHGEAELVERQASLIAVNRIADELFALSVALARAAAIEERGAARAQPLAAIYAVGARARIAALWRELAASDDAEHALVCQQWMRGDLDALLLGDVPGIA